ncbi:hypothetical protein PQX77_020496 [Marasmius sp. AFHP31]|nr:hypothetical protein PQX77_020496 [Marasmius sp. AFHP31]
MPFERGECNREFATEDRHKYWNYAYAETVMQLRAEKCLGTEGSGTISLLFQLPLDIQIEIFGWLHPIDLLRLPRVFPELLISSSTWKSSFQVHVDSALQCPNEVSFPRWASLLFDPHKCDECNIRHALPDLAKVERVCFDCQTRRYIPILGTPIARARLSQESRLCWSRDRMDAVNERLDRLEKEIALGKLGAQDAFDKYREELVAEANGRLMRKSLYLRWYISAQNRCVQRNIRYESHDLLLRVVPTPYQQTAYIPQLAPQSHFVGPQYTFPFPYPRVFNDASQLSDSTSTL